MVKISAEEFQEAWEGSWDGRCVRFYLSPEEIQEWMRHGKFSKIKEYCLEQPYAVKMCCLQPLYNAPGKSFGFVLRTAEDSHLLVAAWYAVKEKRTCVEVEKISFQELEPNVSLLSGYNIETIGAVCPLVI